MFAGGHANRVNPLADCGVSENVVGAGGFFDPPRVKFGQATHVGDRLIDIPDLIGVHHQLAFPAKLFAQDLCPADILLDIRADFLLEMVPAFGNGLTRQQAHFFFGITQPAGGGGVAGEAGSQHLFFPRCLAGKLLPQQGDGFVGRQGVGDVGEIDATHQLLGRHVDEQFPDRLAGLLRPQIPDRVDDGCRRQVNHAFFRPEPAQLAIAGDHFMPVSTEVLGDRFQGAASHKTLAERLDRFDAHFITASVGEGQAVSLQVISRVGVQNDVGG